MRTRSLPDDIVQRAPLEQEGGFSGNTIERVTLRDGRRLIHKRVKRGADWISRATADDGRLPALWDAGVFARMPSVIEHAIAAVDADQDGWSVYMRDVSDALVPRRARLSRSDVDRVLRAITDVHSAFRGRHIDGLCSIEDRYQLLSPRTIRREVELGFGAEALSRGWEAFSRHVPRDIGDVILPLVEDPAPLANELRSCEQTLIHGDLRADNLGFAPGRVVLLDWGSQTGMAPPAVELMWFIGFDALLFDCSREDVVAAFRATYGDRLDERALRLATIGGLVHLATHFGLGLLGDSPTMSRLQADDRTKLALAGAELDWWLRAVETALEAWSPR